MNLFLQGEDIKWFIDTIAFLECHKFLYLVKLNSEANKLLLHITLDPKKYILVCICVSSDC